MTLKVLDFIENNIVLRRVSDEGVGWGHTGLAGGVDP